MLLVPPLNATLEGASVRVRAWRRHRLADGPAAEEAARTVVADGPVVEGQADPQGPAAAEEGGLAPVPLRRQLLQRLHPTRLRRRIQQLPRGCRPTARRRY
jgi:hypothetical protein